jgi:ubiquinone/menaquinone biosynthesis C-methylase UbiE
MSQGTGDRERVVAEARYDVAHPRPSVVSAIGALGLRPGQRVLDAGCGPGAQLGLLIEAVAPGGRVVGLDLEPGNVEAAAALWPEHVASGVLSLESGDVTRLPFAADAFDAAWTSLVLHHVDDPGAALRELARVVAPGGLVTVLDGDDGASFPVLPWLPELEERVRSAVRRGAAESYGGKLDYTFLPYLGRELPRLLREAGLSEITMSALADVDRAPLAPPREVELQNWFRGWVDGRLRDYLAPRDRDAVLALVDPESTAYSLGGPDFFLCRTWLLATGRVPG